MESKFTDNEVREIARMQELIDYYEIAIRSLFFMAGSKDDVVCPILSRSQVNHELKYLWRWIKEHRNKE